VRSCSTTVVVVSEDDPGRPVDRVIREMPYVDAPALKYREFDTIQICPLSVGLFTVRGLTAGT